MDEDKRRRRTGIFGHWIAFFPLIESCKFHYLERGRFLANLRAREDLIRRGSRTCPSQDEQNRGCDAGFHSQVLDHIRRADAILGFVFTASLVATPTNACY